MGRILSEHFNQRGLPKRAFATKEEAKETALSAGKQIYKCESCGSFHIGGTKKWGGNKPASWLGNPADIRACREAGRKYLNEYAAEQAAKVRGGDPYECPLESCGGWHLREAPTRR